MNLKTLFQRRIDAALGRIPCDRVIRNAQYLDVFSCEWRQGDIGIVDGFICSTDSGIKGRELIEGKGKWLVPGFIDAHVHVESSLMIPSYFGQTVVPKGTTAAICDPHELANVLGIEGIRFFLEEAKNLSLDLRVMLSSCVPATHMETNGGGSLLAKDLLPLAKDPKALGLAEVMNVPGVLHQSDEVLDKVLAFQGTPIDGHCPLLQGSSLSAYASVGISSCHESSQLEEAREKLSKGLAVWIREGSVAKDLKALIPLLNAASSPHIGFCTDDRNPLDISQEGHIDFLIRQAIASGVSDSVAYRSASWSVAQHYGLDKGPQRQGAVAPGYAADLVLLDDKKTCTVSAVFKSGKFSNEFETPSNSRKFPNTIKAAVPQPQDLEGPTGKVHAIVVLPGKIITDRVVVSSEDPKVSRLSVLERYGKGSRPANGYAVGFGRQFEGAIASSVGHDSHNLIVVGKKTSDMITALNALCEWGGGFVVVKGGKVLAGLQLPFGGLMTAEAPATVTKKLKELRAASQSIHCELPEPFLQLAFLSLPVIPKLKLTDKGLVDVEKFQIIDVRT